MSDEIMTTAEAAEAAALYRASAVTVPEAEGQPAEDKPLPEPLSRRPAAQKSPAEWAYERIIHYIGNFEDMLDAEQEVALGLVGGDVGVLRIQGVGFHAPDLITFYGHDATGAKMQLIQHVSQLNLMLRAAPKAASDAPARRIGFELVRRLQERAVENV